MNIASFVAQILQYNIDFKSLSTAIDLAASDFYIFNDLSSVINKVELMMWSANPAVCQCISYSDLKNDELKAMVYNKIDCLKSFADPNLYNGSEIFCGIVDSGVNLYSITLSKCLNDPKTAVSCFTNIVSSLKIIFFLWSSFIFTLNFRFNQVFKVHKFSEHWMHWLNTWPLAQFLIKL